MPDEPLAGTKVPSASQAIVAGRSANEGALKHLQGDVNGDAVADVTLLVRTTTLPGSRFMLYSYGRSRHQTRERLVR